MQKQLALLRGVNVSGHKILKMEELRKLMQECGFLDVKTYIQSGNIIYCDSASKEENSAKIKSAIKDKYNYDVGVIILDLKQITTIITNNPFIKDTNADTKQLYVIYLSQVPTLEAVEKMDFTQYAPDEFVIIGNAIYIKFSESAASSKLTNAFLEKRLTVTSTSRNWNTTLKLQELLSD